MVSLLAGTGTVCSSQPCGDNGPATNATIGQPWTLAFDNNGNLYVSLGTSDPRIRKIDANGIITTVAGTGTACAMATMSCGDGGQATSAQLMQPVGVAVDNQGNIYIADQSENRIRKITAATGVISTVAGTGATCSSPTTGTCGDNGAATGAQLDAPQAVAVDSAGNLYIGDTNDNKVRKVSAVTGNITTVAGNGNTCTSTMGGCGDGAAANQAAVSRPRALAFDTSGNLYIAEKNGQRIRKLTVSTAVISTVAGTGATCSSSMAQCGDTGSAINANLNQPTGVAFDNAGNLYIGDQSDNRVRKVSAATGVISTVVGTGALCSPTSGMPGACGDGAAAIAATMSGPSGIAINTAGDLYIGLGDNYQIRKVSFGTFGSIAVRGTGAAQNVLVKTTATETITSFGVLASQGGKQEYSVGTITGCTLNSSTSSGTTCTIPITFAPAYPGFRPMPLQIVTSAGSISFPLIGTGTGPQTSLTPGVITTIAGTGTACSNPTAMGGCADGGSAVSATLNAPRGNFTDASGNVWVADSGDNRVRKFSPGGTITTVAGNGAACSGNSSVCGDGGSATAAQLNGPRSVFVDPAGNVYIADAGDNSVRMVAAGTQIISTVAGTGTACSSTAGMCGDGGLGTAAQLNAPSGLAMDGQGNLYIADTGDHRIRMLAAGYISTVAGTGAPCSSPTSTCGDGGPAMLANFLTPIAIFVDAESNLWIADTGDNRVREVTWAYGAAPGQGLISTVAGTGNACGGGTCGDGSIATSAYLNGPRGIVVDAGGNLYVAETGDSRIRAISASSMVISTVAGTGVAGSSGDNGSATAATVNQPRGLSMDAIGSLIIDDTAGNRIRKVNVTASAFTFASTPYGATSSDSPQTAIFSNIGNTALAFPVPSSGQDPSISNNFLLSSASSSACPVITRSSGSPGSLPSGQNCTLSISFVPQQIGSISGSLVATDTALNSSGTTQTITLSGTATQDSPSLILVSNNNPSTYGSSVTFTASLGYGCTGNLSFQDGSNILGTVAIAGGSASWTTSALSGGLHNIAVSYAGSTNCSSAASPTFSQTINKVAVIIAESSSLNPSHYGDVIRVTYAFTGSASHAIPTGNANLYDGSNLLSTLTLDANGHGSFVTSALPAGSHSLKIVYSGDTNYF